MNLHTTPDIALRITSENSASERRITPAWTIAQLKNKLESVTGVPPSAQRLVLRLPNRPEIALEAVDEDSVQLAGFPLQTYAEIYVHDKRPPGARAALNLKDLADVPKYTMPAETYSTLPDSVLAWKKANKLGRFDPRAPEIQGKKLQEAWQEVETRGIALRKRCRLTDSSTRRGVVAYVGAIPEIPGLEGMPWVGIVLDEPVGKNDGVVGGRRYFECGKSCGLFVRPEKVEVGDWGVYELEDEEEQDEDMEEI